MTFHVSWTCFVFLIEDFSRRVAKSTNPFCMRATKNSLHFSIMAFNHVNCLLHKTPAKCLTYEIVYKKISEFEPKPYFHFLFIFVTAVALMIYSMFV